MIIKIAWLEYSDVLEVLQYVSYNQSTNQPYSDGLAWTFTQTIVINTISTTVVFV